MGRWNHFHSQSHYNYMGPGHPLGLEMIPRLENHQKKTSADPATEVFIQMRLPSAFNG